MEKIIITKNDATALLNIPKDAEFNSKHFGSCLKKFGCVLMEFT